MKTDTKTLRGRVLNRGTEMEKSKQKWWTVWKHSLGSYSDEDTAGHDDLIAIIRTTILSINIACAFLIMMNIVVGWL